jgi:hypothetical protein
MRGGLALIAALAGHAPLKMLALDYNFLADPGVKVGGPCLRSAHHPDAKRYSPSLDTLSSCAS